AIPIGVVEECLDSAGLLALAHRSPPLRTHHQYRWFRHPPCSIEQTLNADEAVQRTAPSPVLRSRLVLVGREGDVAVHALDIDLNDRQAAARCAGLGDPCVLAPAQAVELHRSPVEEDVSAGGDR